MSVTDRMYVSSNGVTRTLESLTERFRRREICQVPTVCSLYGGTHDVLSLGQLTDNCKEN
jgi:hypothetical protein